MKFLSNREEALSLFHELIDQVNDAIFVVDPETGKFLDANEQASVNTGYSHEELLTMHVMDLDAIIQDKTLWKEHSAKIQEKGKILFETINKRKDGTTFPVELNIKHSILGRHTYLIAISRDLTERKQVEEALRESEKRYHILFDQSPDGVLLIDTEGKIIEFNEMIHQQLGYTREEFAKLSIADIDPVETPQEIKDHIRNNLLRGGKAEFEVIHRTKQGEDRFVHVITQALTLSGRTVFHAIWRDITERKQAEKSLREQEELLYQAVRVSEIGIFDHDQRNDTIYWSPQQRIIHGWGPDEPVTLHDFLNRVHPDDLESVSAAVRRAHDPAGDGIWDVEHRIIRRDGSVCWLKERSQTFFEGEGDTRRPVRTVGAALDITERKQAEEKTRQSEQFIRNILDTVDEGFIVLDRDYCIQTANKAYCGQVGVCDEEIVGQHCYEISHKTSRPCYEDGEECAPRRVFETGNSHAALHRHKDTNGNILYVETKAFPIKDASGAVTSVIETINNITEKYLLEEERLKTQKLESIGTLAGGIAHDFNNLLQGIFGYISLAKMTAKNPEKSTAALEQAEKALHQSVNLTTQLLTFAKGGKPTKKIIYLQPVIDNSAKFTLSGSRSDLRLNISEDLWPVEADGGQLGQVVQNIVLNADQAMPIGGTIKITAANVAEGDASLPVGLAKSNYVMIAIQDTGAGIPEKYLSKIFDPYFTTKEKGSGLGLATSYSIIKNHSGMIDIRTKYGEGSTFTIYLPAIATEVRIEAAKIQPQPAESKKAKILVMDDEEIIRNLSSDLLGVLGHAVEVAQHGQEALEKYKSAIATGKPFDLVILDLTIKGGMGGIETVQQMLKIDPKVRAVVSSGYSDDAASANYLSQGFKASLKKPYNVDTLKEVLIKVLNN
jgi:PAS domain S-box-containing protein